MVSRVAPGASPPAGLTRAWARIAHILDETGCDVDGSCARRARLPDIAGLPVLTHFRSACPSDERAPPQRHDPISQPVPADARTALCTVLLHTVSRRGQRQYLQDRLHFLADLPG